MEKTHSGETHSGVVQQDHPVKLKQVAEEAVCLQQPVDCNQDVSNTQWKKVKHTVEKHTVEKTYGGENTPWRKHTVEKSKKKHLCTRLWLLRAFSLLSLLLR